MKEFKFHKLDKILNSIENEIDLEFRPYQMMKYMDRWIDEAVMNQNGNWDLRVYSRINKIWTRWNGSEFNNKIPCMKCEYYFENVDDPSIIIAALLDFRMEWDTDIDQLEELEEYRSENTAIHR